MRRFVFLAVLVLAVRAAGQLPGAVPSTSEIQKRWVLTASSSERDIEHRDGRLDDPEIVEYLQRVEDRVATANGLKAASARITRGTDPYAWLLPNEVLYLSAGMLKFSNSEGELAGLLAHQLAHGRESAMPRVPGPGIPLYTAACVMASRFRPMGSSEDAREAELRATREATAILKTAGYDPASELDLLSKLAYENPQWGKAILADDLLSARASLEKEDVPPAGFRVDSSEFIKEHDRLAVQMETPAARRNLARLRRVP